MVRVGGGWEPLEEFLRKHDSCRGKLSEKKIISEICVGDSLSNDCVNVVLASY